MYVVRVGVDMHSDMMSGGSRVRAICSSASSCVFQAVIVHVLRTGSSVSTQVLGLAGEQHASTPAGFNAQHYEQRRDCSQHLTMMVVMMGLQKTELRRVTRRSTCTATEPY